MDEWRDQEISTKIIKMEYGLTFNEEEKIWRRASKDHGIPLDTLVGPELLKRLRNMDDDKVFEINHANGKETTAKEMYDMSVTCAKNLEELGVKQGEIVSVIANLTYYTTPLCFGCFIQGAIVNPIPVTSTDGEYDFNLLDITYKSSIFRGL